MDMTNGLPFMAILLFIACGHGLILTVALAVMRRGDRLGNLCLSGAMFFFMVLMLRDLGDYMASNTSPLVHFVGVPAVTNFFLGPLLLGYIQSVAKPPLVLKWKMLWFGLPPLLIVPLVTPLYLTPTEDKWALANSMQSSWNWVNYTQAFWNITFVVAMGWTLKKFRQSLPDSGDDQVRWQKRWVTSIFIIIAVIVAMAVTELAISRAEKIWGPIGYDLSDGITALIAVFILFVGTYGLIRPDIFDERRETEKSNKAQAKYEKSKISEANLKTYQSQVSDYLSSSRAFCDPNLTLSKLSKDVGIPPHTLSQVINTGFEKSFPDFINQQRIELAKDLLQQSGAGTILDIAYEVGFNSKSTFYTAFRKFTGMTPKTYLSDHT
jgi:AraC-like DNA-binding protein